MAANQGGTAEEAFVPSWMKPHFLWRILSSQIEEVF